MKPFHKLFIPLLFQLVAGTGISQSPYLSVKASMDKDSTLRNYKIEMSICKLKKGTPYKSIVGRDTSRIDFRKLDSSQFKCGTVFITDIEDEPYNSFHYGNQNYAYELMLIFTIHDRSSRGWNPPMNIILPVKYQSFVTHIEISNIVFKQAGLIFLDNLPDTREDNHLVLRIDARRYLP